MKAAKAATRLRPRRRRRRPRPLRHRPTRPRWWRRRMPPVPASPTAGWRSPTTCSASSATTAACRKPTRPPASSSSARPTARPRRSTSTRCTGPTCRGSRARSRAILTEFGTLIFRLSRLGRDTVDEGRGFLRSKDGAPPAWTALTVLQTAIDWLFVNVLAQLFFHLLLFGAVLLVLGLARPVVPEHRLHLGVAIVLAVLGVLLFLYRRGGSWRSRALPAAMLALAGDLAVRRPAPRSRSPGWSCSRSSPSPTTRSCASPTSAFRSSAPSAWRSGVVLLAAVLMHHFASLGGAGATLDAWRGAALYGTELALAAIKVFWIGLAPLLLLWIASGLVAQARRLRAPRQRRHRPARHRRLALRLRRRDHGPLGAAQQRARPVAQGRGLSAGDLLRAAARRRPEHRAGVPASALPRQHRDLRAAGDPAAHAARVRGGHPVPERARRARGDPQQGPRPAAAGAASADDRGRPRGAPPGAVRHRGAAPRPLADRRLPARRLC